MLDNHLMVLGPGLVFREHFGNSVFQGYFCNFDLVLFQGHFGNFKCLNFGYFGA